MKRKHLSRYYLHSLSQYYFENSLRIFEKIISFHNYRHKKRTHKVFKNEDHIILVLSYELTVNNNNNNKTLLKKCMLLLSI